jgi:N12 class adenine-specific DNA methylase
MNIELPCECVEFNFVGSRATCVPPPTDTDIDLLVRVDTGDDADRYQTVCDKFFQAGWSLDGSEVEIKGRSTEGRFNSFRKDNVNVILTDSAVFKRRFLAATTLARRFNLMNKKDRVALFQAVLYGVPCHTFVHQIQGTYRAWNGNNQTAIDESGLFVHKQDRSYDNRYTQEFADGYYVAGEKITVSTVADISRIESA